VGKKEEEEEKRKLNCHKVYYKLHMLLHQDSFWVSEIFRYSLSVRYQRFNHCNSLKRISLVRSGYHLHTEDTTGNVPRVVMQPARQCALKLELDLLWYTLIFLFLFSKSSRPAPNPHTFYSMASGGKRLKREAYYSPYLVLLLRISRATPPFSRNLHGVYKDNCTSLYLSIFLSIKYRLIA
jgi:hypothetical protein